MVIALSSLVLTPVDGYKGCNVRPYLTRQSPDLSSIVSAVKKRRQVSFLSPFLASPPKNGAENDQAVKEQAERLSGRSYPLLSSSDLILFSYIVGITDPTLLLDLRDFNLLIALSPKREVSDPQEFSPELLRKTEKRASFSGKMTGANKNLTMEDMEKEVLLVSVFSVDRTTDSSVLP
jgi:hypothetical protein